jgi:hypothetical protein
MRREKLIEWVCASCGEKYGRRPCGVACWHIGKCDICGTVTSVTEPRDFGGVKNDAGKQRW